MTTTETETTETPVTPVIDVAHCSYSYPNGVKALDDLGLTVAAGEFVSILGPSGSGKSTVLGILGGLRAPTSGKVEVLGADVTEGRPEQRGRISFVFQDHRLLPWRTVRQNIELVMKAAGVPRDTWHATISRLLTMLQIDRYENAWPMNLSGGQRQRVSIARALAIDPTLILMDEPFSGLDEVTARLLREELLEVWAETGKTVIFVTHSVREALYLADRVCVFTRGPGRIHRSVDVPLGRPRSYEDLKLAELEADVVGEVLELWGISSKP